MEQRDYLLRQIQQMTQAFVALIRKLTGLKEESSESEEELQQTTNEMLKEHFEMEISEIMKIPVEELADWIINKKGVHLSNLELFAEVMYLNAKVRSEVKEQQKLLKIALGLFTHADQLGNTFSIERQVKIKEIAALIESDE